jgi:DNA-binding NarL/FixJ family response regulator
VYLSVVLFPHCSHRVKIPKEPAFDCAPFHLKELTMPTPITDLRVLIVADDPLARSGVATLLAAQPGYTVTGQVPSDADLVATFEVYRPDVVLWDLGWDPTLAPSTELRTNLEQWADLEQAGPPVVVLLPDEAQAAEAWAAGARGLLLREVTAERLVATLSAVAQGLMVLDPTLADALQPSRDLVPTHLEEELTPRELEVLRLLAEGLSNRAIAYQLGISEHTVKFHVNAIMGKLGAQSRTEAAVRATRLGLILL